MTEEYDHRGNQLEYKEKNSFPNLYSILGLTIDVCKDPNCDEIIRKAYNKKAALCHPDKNPGRDDIAELFRYLTEAYEILKDEKLRNNYNARLLLDKQSSSDFLKLKKGTEDYIKSTGEYIAPNDQQKLSFKEKMAELNKKHGYDTSIESVPISKNDAKKKLNEISKDRAVQDLKLKPENLFEGGSFSLKKFNEAFDKTHVREPDAIVPHNGVPAAWNDMNAVAGYSSFDNLDNLYVEDSTRLDTSRQNYSGIEFSKPSRKITKEDMKNITGDGATYVDTHNVLGDEYYKELKQKLRERKSDGGSFDSMKLNDFKRNDTAGYGIFDQIGFDYGDQLELDSISEDDITKKFNRLMMERQQLDSGSSNQMPMQQERKSKKENGKKWR